LGSWRSNFVSSVARDHFCRRTEEGEEDGKEDEAVEQAQEEQSSEHQEKIPRKEKGVC
jgi:hypothetical protein